jgi:quinol monooxygenase YgiN
MEQMISRRHVVAIAMGMSVFAGTARAQDQGAAFVVTYIETESKSTGAARDLLKAYAAAATRTGAVQFDAFERTDQPHHFAIIETWANVKAQEEHAATPAAKDYRAKLAPLLAAPYDERPHVALSAGAKVPTKAGTVFAITHVDIIPPKKDEGVASVKALAEKSRGTPGNLRFDALTQVSRPNHMTIVEMWSTKAAMDTHRNAPNTKQFRDGLLPMSGSLHDQRLYRPVR